MAAAHHGFGAHYDADQYVTIEGVVTDFEFVNPHSFVYIETTDDAGDTVVRWCEMQARTQMHRKGITAHSFAVGDRITVGGFQARRDPLGCEFAEGVLADGSILTLRSREGQSLYSAPVVTADSGIFGTWHRKAFPGAGSETNPKDVLTAAGAAAHENYDVLTENPILTCSPVSPVRAWSQPGTPTEIRRDGDDVIIRHEFMDVVRVIHMNTDGYPGDAPRTDVGYSIGRFEGGDLLIETAHFSAASIRAGNLHTEDFKFSETLTIDPDNGDLVLTWTATDPLYYSEPLYGSRIMIRTDLAMGRYDCVPEIGHEARAESPHGPFLLDGDRVQW